MTQKSWRGWNGDSNHRRWATYYNWLVTLEFEFEDVTSMIIPYFDSGPPGSVTYFSGRWEYTAPQADPVVRELYDSLQERLRREAASQDGALTTQR